MSVHTKPARIYKHQANKFAKLAAFNSMIDEGGELAKAGRQAKKATHQHWIKREMQAKDFHKRKNSKPSACIISK